MPCTSLTSVGEPPEVCSGGNLFTWLKTLYYAVCDAIDTLTAALSASAIPPGIMTDYGGVTAPSGWLLCDGSAVSRTTYAALFAAIGTAHGSGDGTTTFNLPDKRDRVSVGKGNMGGTAAGRIPDAWSDTLGGTGGSATHTLVTNEIPPHNHPLVTHLNSNNPATDNWVSDKIGDDNGAATTMTSNSIGNTGGGQAHNNVQPSIALNVIIKY